MDLQVVLPDESPAMEPETLIELGTQAERLGYHTVWLPDHLLPPAAYGEVYGGVYEPLVTLSYLAARTSTIRLGTSVLVLPMRSPFVVAKQTATLDRLSRGRVTLGVGVGWDRVEFDAVGADFSTRGRRTDEAIEVLRQLFAGGGGRGVFEPVPSGAIPILVGGQSERALRRAATLADEWQGVGLTPTAFGEWVARLRGLTDRSVRCGTRIAWAGGTDLAGSAGIDGMVDEARAFERAGADALAISFGSFDGFDARMTAFAEAVRR